MDVTMYKKCSRCLKRKQTQSFYTNKRSGNAQNPCKECVAIADAKNYADPLKRARKVEQARAHRAATKAKIFSVFHNHCNRCPVTDTDVLELHHRAHNGNDAEEQLMRKSIRKMLLAVLDHSEEFELLCCNCHRKHHVVNGTDLRQLNPRPSSPY
jgi:hypothetical protein